MNWLHNVSISKKIAGGYTILAVLMGLSVLLVLKGVKDLDEINTRVFELRAPTVLTSTKMVNGVNRSLAGLRGWMILHKDKFKQERAQAWQEMDESYSQLQAFSNDWTNTENIERLQEVGGILEELRQVQQEIEDISGTIDNTPANKILFQEAAPRADDVVKGISRMMEIESRRSATKDSKKLLGIMADVRASLGMSLASIRAFLLSGDKKFINQFQSFWAINDMRYKDLRRGKSKLSDKQLKVFKRLHETREELKLLPPKMIKIRGSEQWNVANYWLATKAGPRTEKILEILRAMEVSQGELEADDVALAKATAEQLNMWIIFIGIVSVLFAIVVAVFVTRMIVIPVARAAKGLQLIAAGKLDKRWRIESQDELGSMLDSLNEVSESLTDVVSDVINGATSIDVAAKQVSNGNMELSQRTEEQASSLEETASSMEEMTSTVKQNADNADQANQLAKSVKGQAEAGGRVVNDAVQAMTKINESSNNIADIISVVEEISFQTNLLALNAAVEAARAGESGRGFAVVASEVRVLAGRSANAAKEIKTLIEDSLSKVKIGAELVDKSGETLGEILTGVNKVSDIVSEIAAASSEQSSGIEQVNKAIMQMDGMTQMNASLVEKAASASRSMEDQAAKLNERVKFFDLGDNKVVSKVEKKSVPAAVKIEQTTPKKVLAENKPLPAIGNDNEWQDF